MKHPTLYVVALLLAAPAVSRAQNPLEQLGAQAGKALGNAAKGELEKRINTKLLDEARKNQCSFKSGTDEPEWASTWGRVGGTLEAFVRSKPTFRP